MHEVTKPPGEPRLPPAPRPHSLRRRLLLGILLPVVVFITYNTISGYRRGVDIYRTGTLSPVPGPGASLDVVIGGATTDSNTIQNGDNTAAGAGIRVLDMNGTTAPNSIATITGNVSTVTTSGVGIDEQLAG